MGKKKSGSSRYFVLLIFLFSILFFGVQGLNRLFRNLDYFNIEKIEIVGNQILETDFLLNISLDLMGKNILSVSKREITAKYENISRIKRMRIKKILPRKLLIKFEERNAIFLVKTLSGQLFPVDGEGVYLDNLNFDIREVLPIVNTQLRSENVISGTSSEDNFLLEVIDLHYEIRNTDNDFFEKISEIYENNGEICLIEMENGFQIILGKGNIADKINRYNFVEQNRKFEKNSIVDLRFKDKLIVRSEDE